MNQRIVVPMLIGFMGQIAASQQPPILAGTWNVTSTATGDFTCTGVKQGDTNAYIWIVSASPDGLVQVSVQGETAFPKLKGYWNPRSRTLFLDAHSSGFRKTATWFKLVLDERGNLRGTRRFLSDSQSRDAQLCFADFEIVAKRM